MNIFVKLNGRHVNYMSSISPSGDLIIDINSSNEDVINKPDLNLSDDELNKKLIKFFVQPIDQLNTWFSGAVDLRKRYEEEIKGKTCQKCRGGIMRKYLSILSSLYKEGKINVR